MNLGIAVCWVKIVEIVPPTNAFLDLLSNDSGMNELYL